MVFKLKYSAKTYMAKIIGEIMADSLLESHQDLVARMDIITFVPLNKKRLEARGFNQAEKIGAYLADLIGLPMVSLVERVKNTDKLHGLSSQERRRMLKNSFKLKEEGFSLQENFTASELPGLSKPSSEKPEAGGLIAAPALGIPPRRATAKRKPRTKCMFRVKRTARHGLATQLTMKLS